MVRLFVEPELVLASHNTGKIIEFRSLLAPYGVTLLGGPDFNIAEPEETADTFAGNALIKSEAFMKATGKPSLADDSGIEVKALDGAPGIYSARWGGNNRDFYAAMLRVEKELKEKGLNPQGAEARFICVLSLTWPDGETVQYEGTVEGTLTFPPRGTNGHGYDPIFVPNGYDQTFGELPDTMKDKISHRANATRDLLQACFAHRLRAVS